MPPDVRDQLNHLKEDHKKMIEAAEEAGKNGDDGAKNFKMMLAGDMQEKIDELLEEYPEQEAAPAAPPGPPGGAMMLANLPPPPGLMPPGRPQLPGLMPPGRPQLPGLMPPGRPPFPAIVPPPGAGGFPPGIAPPQNMQDMQRMMMLSANPDMGANITLQRALEWEQEKASSGNMEPEIIELAHHFNLTDRHSRMLDEQLKKRNNTYEDDIAAMYEILKGAKNPADLLMVSIRWMSEGIFRGTLTPNPDVEKAAKKYKLDAPSACKLAEVLESRKDPDEDLRKIGTHLERSNKPSSLVMMMLRDLKQGKPIGDCKQTPAIGSFLHREENKKNQRGGGRSRSRGGRGRSRGRGGGGGGGGGRRSPSRGGRGGRSRSRGRGGGGGRSRSRGGDRGGDRGGGGRGGGGRSRSRGRD